MGSARVVDERHTGEDPPPPTPGLHCRSPLVQPMIRNEEACRDTPSVDREGWVGHGCVESPWYVGTRSCVVGGTVPASANLLTFSDFIK